MTLGAGDDSQDLTHRAVHLFPGWQIRNVLSMGRLSGYTSESLTMDDSGCSV